MIDLLAWVREDPMRRENAMNPEAAEQLAFLAMGRDTIIEIGCFCGAMTRLFSVLAREVHSVDHFEGDWAAGEFDPGVYGKYLLTNGQAIKEGQVIVHKMSSDEAAVELRNQGVTADFIWIDGDHSYEQCKRDIENYMPLLRPGGLMCGHDAGTFQGVNQAVQELLPDAWFFTSWMWAWTPFGRPVPPQYRVICEDTTLNAVKMRHDNGDPADFAVAYMRSMKLAK